MELVETVEYTNRVIIIMLKAIGQSESEYAKYGIEKLCIFINTIPANFGRIR